MKNNSTEIFYKLARPSVRDLEEYNPGTMPADCVRISANENNYGFSPKAYEAMVNAVREGNRYPDSRCTELRVKLADNLGLMPEQLLVGNGLDGVFTMLGRAFLDPGDEVICGELTFSVYVETASIMAAVPVLVPMTAEKGLDVQGFIDAVSDKTKMIVFCNPNNPTGTVVSLPEIKRILDSIPKNVIFVLDEAYIEFADDPKPVGLSLLNEYPNLMVCRTFSKIFGLAGLRIGWIAADPELLVYLYKVREPYSVTGIAAAGAIAALGDKVFFEETLKIITEERNKLCDFFAENDIDFIPSQGNFILLPAGGKSNVIREALLEDGIVVRLLPFRDTQMLRISIGLPEENRLLEKSLLKHLRSNI